MGERKLQVTVKKVWCGLLKVKVPNAALVAFRRYGLGLKLMLLTLPSIAIEGYVKHN